MLKQLRSALDRYRWFFVAEGVVGNLLFFVGSILFLRESTQQMGVWLFIAGSGLMLVSSAATAAAERDVE
ncbi:YrhK family protein [Aeoliella sp. SH292]|uniref:YrhK family protein n=1 Tax=Aeoliella sp. SH292 TaxID=3454464 RepID=UPI003F9DDA0B